MKPRQSHRAVAVLREPVFSPGMVEHDAAILRATAAELTERGVSCPVLSASDLDGLGSLPELVVSMADSDESLALLEQLERRGAIVVNSPAGVRATRREALLALSGPAGPLVEGALVATDRGGHVPPSILASGSVWVKRADYHALGPGDVVRVDAAALTPALRAMHARGIGRAVVQPHLEGPVVKFYGVAGPRPFFRTFVIESKDPATGEREAAPTPSPRDLEQLADRAFRAAEGAGLSVFGGDAVLAKADAPVVIDLNAWPSFWRCLGDAAIAIADHAASRIGVCTPSRVA